MDPTSVIDDSGFWLPDEFLTDDDFLVEKENKALNDGGIEEDHFFAGLSKKMVKSTLEDDISGGFCSNHAFPVGNYSKAWNMNRSPLCAAGIDCACRNQSRNSQVSSQAAAWDLYCAAAEEVAKMNINDDSYGYNNFSDRGLLDLPRNLNRGSNYYNHRSLSYYKLQALQFQQLKQEQLMKHQRQLVQRQLVQQSRERLVNSNKIGPVDLSSSTWSNQQLRRDGSSMRAVFIGDKKRSSTGTGVFLPRGVNRTSPVTGEARRAPSGISTVLVPARVAEVLNLKLDESVVQPVVQSSASLNDVSWRQSNNNGGFSSQMKIEQQPVNEPRLPTDWAY